MISHFWPRANPGDEANDFKNNSRYRLPDFRAGAAEALIREVISRGYDVPLQVLLFLKEHTEVLVPRLVVTSSDGGQTVEASAVRLTFNMSGVGRTGLLKQLGIVRFGTSGWQYIAYKRTRANPSKPKLPKVSSKFMVPRPRKPFPIWPSPARANPDELRFRSQRRNRLRPDILGYFEMLDSYDPHRAGHHLVDGYGLRVLTDAEQTGLQFFRGRVMNSPSDNEWLVAYRPGSSQWLSANGYLQNGKPVFDDDDLRAMGFAGKLAFDRLWNEARKALR